MVDASTVGVWFVALGVLLLIIEVMMPGFFVAIPGTVLIVLGILAFVAPSIALDPVYSPLIVIAVGVPATLGTIFAYKRLAPATAPPTTTAGGSLVGREALVTVAVEPDTSRGKVRIDRQVWSATSDAPIAEGEHVVVDRVDGVILQVKRKE